MAGERSTKEAAQPRELSGELPDVSPDELPGEQRDEAQKEPRWLDRHLAGRLAEFSGCLEPPRSKLERALGNWQWERLCATLRAAASGSLHYRESVGRDRAESLIRTVLEETGNTKAPGEPGAAARLARQRVELLLSLLPFTLPAELAASPESFLAVSHDEVGGVISLPTSGTTGRGKRIFSSPADMATTAAFFRHGMQYLVRPETGQGEAGEAKGRAHGRPDRVVLLMSGDRPGSVGELLQQGMLALGVPCVVAGFVPPGRAGEDAMMERLRALEPTCLVGLPAQLFSLARHAGARGLGLRGVLLSGDAATKPLRRGIEEGFACPVFVHYGLTECGLGGAVECGGRCGSHMREADLYHEVVDERGRAVPPGEWGEIVITTLTREAMPLVRYRTGDLGRVLAEPCACGSVFRRIVIRDRLSRSLLLPCGDVLRGVALDEALFPLPGLKSYALTVYRDERERPNGFLLELSAVPGTDEKALEAEARKALEGVPGFAPGQGALPFVLRTVEGAGAENPRLTQAKMRFCESGEAFPI